MTGSSDNAKSLVEHALCSLYDAGHENGDNQAARKECITLASETVFSIIARERQKAVDDTVVKIMSTETEGLFDNGDLFIKRAPIEQVIINLIGFEKFKAIQDAVSAAQSKESK